MTNDRVTAEYPIFHNWMLITSQSSPHFHSEKSRQSPIRESKDKYCQKVPLSRSDSSKGALVGNLAVYKNLGVHQQEFSCLRESMSTNRNFAEACKPQQQVHFIYSGLSGCCQRWFVDSLEGFD
eukprot:jgi/Psemu1/6959/gm1.6959_g